MSVSAYIFDIDGTIANGDHRLHHIKKEPKDWKSYFAACVDDSPITHIHRLINDLAQKAIIVYVSGRSDEVRAETEAWIRQHDFPAGKLYMRKAGDHRNDDIVKIEILGHVLDDGYVPIMAFDDRDRVVAAWRANGIPCAQVAPGDF